MRTAPFTNFAILAVPMLVALFLVGCSGPPSESVGEHIIAKKIQDQSKGLIKLVSFRKTNAVSERNCYAMAYEVEVQFQDDAGFAPSQINEFYAQRGIITQGVMNPLEQKRKGETMKRTGSLVFLKTEKGWSDEDGNIY